MRKHLISTLVILVMIFLAFGSTDSNTAIVPSGQPVSTDSSTPAQPTPPPTSRSEPSTSEVDRVFAARTKQYEEADSARNSANELREEAKAELAELQSRIQTLEREKPIPPKYETREWGTFDGKYKTHAALVTTDVKSVTLRKPDGEVVTVPKLKLRTEDTLYIASTFSKTAVFEARLKKWEKEREGLLSRLPSVQVLAESAAAPMPTKPTREDVVNELAAAEARRSEDARLAEVAQREAQRELQEREAARKAEEEYDTDGLVLLKKSVKGTRGEFGGEITGQVVNRRNRKLGYVQITFLLFDESGAQVGNALDNINGLEAGGTWKFNASTLGTDFSSYKFNELTGF